MKRIIAALIVLVLAGCEGDRYSRLACDYGTGQAYIITRWTSGGTISVVDTPELDADCHARMGIKDVEQ